MFFVDKGGGDTVCVANCKAAGLFYDATNNMCVGCHPACKSCFGPDNDDCYECNHGFVKMNENTCDTECYPPNSYLINGNVCQRKY
jgi:hypothetical protein